MNTTGKKRFPMNTMAWISKISLQLLVWRTAHIKAHCMGCGEWIVCGKVPDIGFMCDRCQAQYGYLPTRK